MTTDRRVSDALSKDANSLGLVRLVLALMVLASHSWSIGGFGTEPLIALSGGTSLGTVAVCGFFALSGILIAISAERTSTDGYLRRRIARIMPGYWLALVVGGVGIGALICLVRGIPVRESLMSPSIISAPSYVVNNLFLGADQYQLGTVLDGMAYPSAINGSLWSLPYEFVCYLLVLAVVRWAIAARHKVPVLAVIGGLSLLLAVLTNVEGSTFPPLAIPLLGPLDAREFFNLWLIFFAGSLLGLAREHIILNPTVMLASWTWVIASLWLHLFWPVGALALPYALLSLAHYSPPAFRAVGRRADLSYGMYLYGFPATQLVVALRWADSALSLFVIASLATVPFAAFSWYGFERLFIGTRPRQRKVRQPTTPVISAIPPLPELPELRVRPQDGLLESPTSI